MSESHRGVRSLRKRRGPPATMENATCRNEDAQENASQNFGTSPPAARSPSKLKVIDRIQKRARGIIHLVEQVEVHRLGRIHDEQATNFRRA